MTWVGRKSTKNGIYVYVWLIHLTVQPKLHNIEKQLFVVIQLLSHVWLFETPRTAAYQASLSYIIFQSWLKFMSIESVMPSNISSSVVSSSPAFNLSQHQGLLHESVLHIRWPRYWSFSFSISLSNEYSGLISFRDGLVWTPCSSRDSQESSLTPQFKSIDSSALLPLNSTKSHECLKTSPSSNRLYFLGLQNHCRWWLQPWN